MTLPSCRHYIIIAAAAHAIEEARQARTVVRSSLCRQQHTRKSSGRLAPCVRALRSNVQNEIFHFSPLLGAIDQVEVTPRTPGRNSLSPPDTTEAAELHPAQNSRDDAGRTARIHKENSTRSFSVCSVCSGSSTPIAITMHVPSISSSHDAYRRRSCSSISRTR